MRVAIAGAGAVGRSIAAELVENGHEVLVIDKDSRAIDVDAIPGAEWVLADACEIANLDEVGLDRCQVAVAATGDDKVNLVVSLLAKTEYGVPRVVARVNDPVNEWLFDESWGVDVAVSTPRLLSALVEEAVECRRPGSADDIPTGTGQPGRVHPATDRPICRSAGGLRAVAGRQRARGHPARQPGHRAEQRRSARGRRRAVVCGLARGRRRTARTPTARRVMCWRYDPDGRNSYLGLNITRRPSRSVIRPSALITRPGSIPGIRRRPIHTTSTEPDPSHSSACRDGDPPRGWIVTVRNMPTTQTCARSRHRSTGVPPLSSDCSCRLSASSTCSGSSADAKPCAARRATRASRRPPWLRRRWLRRSRRPPRSPS